MPGGKPGTQRSLARRDVSSSNGNRWISHVSGACQPPPLQSKAKRFRRSLCPGPRGGSGRAWPYRRERNGRGLPEAAKWEGTRSESPLKARRELYPPGFIALWQAVCGFTEPHAYVRAYRAPGASPQWREAGRGAERGARWSPQPSMRLRRTPNGVKKVLPGRAQPFQILAPGGGMGKPGLPIPLAEGLCSRKKRQAAPRTWVLLLLGYSPLNPGSMPENTRKALARCPMRGIDGALHALL